MEAVHPKISQLTTDLRKLLFLQDFRQSETGHAQSPPGEEALRDYGEDCRGDALRKVARRRADCAAIDGAAELGHVFPNLGAIVHGGLQ